MHVVLVVSTVLGGLSALWFLYDKRYTIASWFDFSAGDFINPLSLPDEEFSFLSNRLHQLLKGTYLPVNSVEENLCRSLANLGILKNIGGNKFKVTGAGKKILSENHA